MSPELPRGSASNSMVSIRPSGGLPGRGWGMALLWLVGLAQLAVNVIIYWSGLLLIASGIAITLKPEGHAECGVVLGRFWNILFASHFALSVGILVCVGMRVSDARTGGIALIAANFVLLVALLLGSAGLAPLRHCPTIRPSVGPQPKGIEGIYGDASGK